VATKSRGDRPTSMQPTAGTRPDAAPSRSPRAGPARAAGSGTGVVKRQHGGVRGGGAARSGSRRDGGGETADGDLVIGEGVRFSGRIRACERLVVAGRLDAEFAGHCLEIRDGGRYQGEAHVRMANVHGTFEGTLRVEGTLTLGATARVSGTIRYDTLEIAAGGELRGDVDRIDSARDDSTPTDDERPEHGGALGGHGSPGSPTVNA